MKKSFRMIAVILTASIISTFGVSVTYASDNKRESVTQKAAARQLELLKKAAARAIDRASTSPTLKNEASAREAVAAVSNAGGAVEVVVPAVYPILVLKAGMEQYAKIIQEGSMDPVSLAALKVAYADASKIYNDAKVIHIAKLKADFDAAVLAFDAAGGGSGNERGALMGVAYQKYMAELAYLLALKYL